MFTSFSTALSALNAMDTAIDVVGNNLANLNTTGFKTSEVCFEDLVTQSLGADLGETQVGFGVGTPLTLAEFTQGAVQTTDGVLDGAIQGDGFFVVQDPSGQTMYTRAGNFETDKSGNLMTANGDYVQGWMVDPTTGQIDTNAPIGDIVVPTGSLSAATPTSNFSMDVNLNAGATADSTSEFSQPLTVYDSLGDPHTLTVDFQKTGTNQWSYQITVPGDDVSGGTAGTPFDISGGSGTLTFDQNGNLTDPAAGSPVSFSITGLTDGAADMNLNWNLYTSAGAPTITQYSQPSAESASSQDGKAAGQLDSVGLSDGGQILAKYSNGDQLVVGQVALANIRNPDSLIAVGDNNFEASAATAAPSIGVPGTGGRGDVVGGSLEASTVDIAQEFTDLITYQSGYEANARVVTTADQLAQDTINLIHP
jgi:flagellar hook protein FlgE